ncbi:hypothetical protein NT6N_18660 [Oceaniferula spumae]|uniref:Uncharacterized protein n=1 Tax=Oceaniferula spumae TaxID=2979115 RepID=A0AAT9FLM7_9BACT
MRLQHRLLSLWRLCTFLSMLGLLALSPTRSIAEEKKPENKNAGGEFLLKIMGALADKDRPVWDQQKAEAILADLIKKENAGDFAWEKIPWETDAKKAAARAKKEQKPILTYIFLKRDVGPAAAPC